MIRTRTIACVALAAVAAVSLPGLARANTVTIDNTTEVAYYNGSSPYNAPGSYWGAPEIGAPVYNTPSMTLTGSSSVVKGVSMSSLTITFSTGLFAGVDKQYSPTDVYAADIFINSGSGATTNPNGVYNYAISLGFDGQPGADGGYSTAGLYKIGTGGYENSTAVWQSRTGFYYGGQYAPAADFTNGTCNVDVATCSAGVASPTVLLDKSVNTLDNQITVSNPVSNSGNGTLGTLSVTLTGTTAAMEAIFGDFDIFWGTGDCSNAPIWGDVKNVSFVPEPSTLAILASALVLLGVADRRRRRTAKPV